MNVVCGFLEHREPPVDVSRSCRRVLPTSDYEARNGIGGHGAARSRLFFPQLDYLLQRGQDLLRVDPGRLRPSLEQKA